MEVRVGTNTYEYLLDPLGRRVGKKVNGVLNKGWVYQGFLTPAAEVNSNNQVVARFVYATRVNVPDYMVTTGNVYRIITDHLGSVRLVIDVASGDVVQRLDYDEWGNVLQDSNPGFQPFGFAGGLYDPDTGLTRFGYRDYDPTTGRWLAKDPILFRGGQANLYVYIGNDPVNKFDPYGTGEEVKLFFQDIQEIIIDSTKEEIEIIYHLIDDTIDKVRKGLCDAWKDVTDCVPFGFYQQYQEYRDSLPSATGDQAVDMLNIITPILDSFTQPDFGDE